MSAHEHHEELATWDAAYVLGALSTADRAVFEAHLAHCAACREAVARLAPIPGLLSRVPADRAEELLGAAEATAAGAAEGTARGAAGASGHDEGRAALIDLARRRTRRTRRRRAVAALAAAAAAVALLVAGSALDLLRPDPGPAPGPDTTVALDQVGAAPVEASIGLTSVPWGTKLDLSCRYTAAPDGGYGGSGREYALVVIGADGAETTLSTWRAEPGATAHLSAGTALPATEIAALEIRASDSGAVLLRGDMAWAGDRAGG